METKTIAKINDIEIAVSNDELQLVPIKPICEALGIATWSQTKKIKEDEFLSSVATLSMATGADGKQYEMCCLPLKYVYGWLFTINPKNVAPEAEDAVSRYRIICYNSLYDYFNGSQKKLIEQNSIEINLLEEIADLNMQKTSIFNEIVNKKKKLDQLRGERLKNELTLF